MLYEVIEPGWNIDRVSLRFAPWLYRLSRLVQREIEEGAKRGTGQEVEEDEIPRLEPRYGGELPTQRETVYGRSKSQWMAEALFPGGRPLVDTRSRVRFELEEENAARRAAEPWRHPWPRKPAGPLNDPRYLNTALYPDLRKPKPKRRPCVSHLPREVDPRQARVLLYRPEGPEDFLWHIRLCFTDPRPWEVEAWVDPGDDEHLAFFREIRVRLPLKAKARETLVAHRDRAGQRWRGYLADKLNNLPGVREQLERTLAAGAGSQGPGVGGRGNKKKPGDIYVPVVPLLGPRPVLEGPEGFAMTIGPPVYEKMWFRRSLFADGTRDGLLARRDEEDRLPGHNFDKYEERPRRVKRGRPTIHRRTALQRWAAVRTSARIVPTGPRHSELTVVLRPGRKAGGLAEAFALARLTEAAIKYRKPPRGNRKMSWRQQLKSTLLWQPGLLTHLVRRSEWGLGDDTLPVGEPRLTPAEVHRTVKLIDEKRANEMGLPRPSRAINALEFPVGGFRLLLPRCLVPDEVFVRWRNRWWARKRGLAVRGWGMRSLKKPTARHNSGNPALRN